MTVGPPLLEMVAVVAAEMADAIDGMVRARHGR
jgi:hypothetical protein